MTSIPDLLERERELEALREAVARTREGAGSAVLIEAQAGVGKSRLMASARALARDAGLEVLEARGAVLERELAFGVARQLFEQRVSSATEAERDALFAGAAGLSRRLLGHEGPELAQDGDAAFGALHGLYWLTANLADHGPVVLAVDDAHWADPASLHVLGYLLRRLEGLSVLIVAAGRTPDPEGERLWQELAEDPAAEVLQPASASKATTTSPTSPPLRRDSACGSHRPPRAPGCAPARCARARGGRRGGGPGRGAPG